MIPNNTFSYYMLRLDFFFLNRNKAFYFQIYPSEFPLISIAQEYEDLSWKKTLNLQDAECFFFQKLKIIECTDLQELMHTQQLFSVKSHNLLLETAVLQRSEPVTTLGMFKIMHYTFYCIICCITMFYPFSQRIFLFWMYLSCQHCASHLHLRYFSSPRDPLTMYVDLHQASPVQIHTGGIAPLYLSFNIAAARDLTCLPSLSYQFSVLFFLMCCTSFLASCFSNPVSLGY